MSTDVLLTHGYCLAEDPAEAEIMRPYPPLGLLYLTSYLRSRGLSVQVADTTFSTLEAVERQIRGTRPRLLGIYANLMTRRNVLRLLKFATGLGIPTVVGGPDPAPWVDEYLRAGATFVAEGEGERTVEELVHALQGVDPKSELGLAAVTRVPLRTIAGLHWLEGATRRSSEPRVKTKDLDALPFPARDAIDLEAYVSAWRNKHGFGAVSIITARGCPFRCDWCSHAVFGHTHRRRSVKSVADEVELIRRTYAPDRLWYADDVFTIHRRWLFDYARELDARGLHTPFETITREDCLDDEVLSTLSRMQCKKLWIGAESGSQKILDAMSRKTDAVRMREMVKAAQARGIEVGTFVMVGYEGEDSADIEATRQHLLDALPDQVLTTVAYPIKGTGYYEKVKGRVSASKTWSEGSDRDHTVLGRHSRRYYEHARAWIHHSVEHQRLQRTGKIPTPAQMRHGWLATRARLAMKVTEHEREHGRRR